MSGELEGSLVRPLGRTGRVVHRLGVASSYGVGGADVERAVEEHGVSYLYWGSYRSKRFGDAIRALCQRGQRDRLFIVIQSYSRFGWLVRRSLARALRRLGIERADLLLLGWWNRPVWARVLEAAEACREQGLVCHLGISTHQRTLVPRLAGPSPVDVIHFRYNAANRGAETEIFPHLPATDRAGLVAFTATRWGSLLRRPRGAPEGIRVPTAGDCYRYVLARPDVDVCMSGPRNGQDLQEALAAVEKGPLPPDELSWMREFGDLVYRRRRPREGDPDRAS